MVLCAAVGAKEKKGATDKVLDKTVDVIGLKMPWRSSIFHPVSKAM